MLAADGHAVHVVTGRGRDRLGREDHDAVAALLGHDDPDDLLAAVSDAGRTIAYALLRAAQEVELTGGGWA